MSGRGLEWTDVYVHAHVGVGGLQEVTFRKLVEEMILTEKTFANSHKTLKFCESFLP